MRGTEDFVVGKYHWPLEFHFSANATVRLLQPIRPNELTISRIGGICTLVGPQTRRIIEGVLPADEWIDGDGFGEGY